MLKTVCLALICMLGLSSALALRPNNDAVRGNPSAVPSADDAPSVNSASKGDKLAVVASSVDVKKPSIEAIHLAPAQIESKLEPGKSPITSWHWHAGSKTVTRK